MFTQAADIYDPVPEVETSRNHSLHGFVSSVSCSGDLSMFQCSSRGDFHGRSQLGSLPPGMISLPPTMIPTGYPGASACQQQACVRDFSTLQARLPSPQSSDQDGRMLVLNGSNSLADISGSTAAMKLKLSQDSHPAFGKSLAASLDSAFSKVGGGGGGPDGESAQFSKKVFVGGLPPDIDGDEIMRAFWRFGPLQVDWPTKGQTKHVFPPKGYVFLIFQFSASVERLVDECYSEEDEFFYVLSSASQRNKIVQVRPWRLSDGECHFDRTKEVNSRLTAFVGGVPRPLRADQLAKIMNDHFGNVCHAVISVDEDMDYPRGAGKVTFSTENSYINAIQTRYVEVKLGDLQKKVELKPYEDTAYERQRPREAHRNAGRRPFFHFV